MSLSIGLLNYVQSYLVIALDFAGTKEAKLAVYLVMAILIVVVVIRRRFAMYPVVNHSTSIGIVTF